MAVTLSLFAGAGAQFLDNNGVMLSGGLVYTYAAGTTTPLAAYTSNTGDTALANPIVLDASGRVPTGQIWLTYGQGYKFTVRTSTGVLIGTYDNIPSAALPPLVNDAASISYEQGASVTAGNFIIGETYLITFIGTTNFQSIGAVSNTVGIYFTATGVGSGSGTAEVSRTVKAKFQETVSVKDFGAIGDGIADDTAAIQAARDYIFGQTTPSVLIFPAGIYLYSLSPNWNIQNCQVIAEGVVRLRYTGTGNAFEVIDTSGTGLYNQTFGRFIIEAPSTAQNGVYIKNSNHSTFDFNVRGCGTAWAGLRIDFAVCSYFPNFICSNNENNGVQGWYLNAKPKYGIYIYSITGGVSEPTSYCSFINPVIEGVDIGTVLDHSLGNMFIGGTMEGCTDTGLLVGATRARKNVVIHTDFEANTNYDIDCYGQYNSFLQCDTQKIVIMRQQAKSNTLDGGVHQSVYCEVNSASNILKDFIYGDSSLAGALTDLGRNIWQRLLKIGDSYVSNGPQVNTPLTIGPSPYTYTNTYVSPIRILVGGGTVTSTLQGRTGSALTMGTTGIYTLDPGEYLTITYTVLPTVIVWVN